MNSDATDPLWTQALALIADIAKISLGAFFGAACAFYYERRRKRDEEQAKRSVTLRKAQFAMMAHITSLLLIQQQALEPQAGNPERWAELLPFLNVTDPPEIPVAELSFLLDDFDPNLLGEIVIARDKFNTVCEIISDRNEKHEELQRLIEDGKSSQRLKAQLTHLTEALYEQLPEAVLFLNAVSAKMGQLMKKHFKGINFLCIGGEAEQMIKKLQQDAAAARLKTLQ